jgi:integrase
VDSGDSQPTSREPFRSYASQWIESYTGRTARGLSDSTRASYKDAIDRLAIPFFGTVALDRIDPPLLRKFIAYLAKRGLAPASVRRAYAPVRALLATAYDDGQLRSNPAAGVRVVVKDRRTRVPKWLTVEQTKALLAEMPIQHSDLCFVLAATGCRISEALGARWGDIERGDEGIVLRIRKAKTEAGLRSVALSPETVRRLTRRRAEATYAADGDPIFSTRNGTAIDSHNWRGKVFNSAAERAGVPWATPHKLRHGLASLMAHEGYGAAQIAQHLGHSDGGALALRTYIHPDGLDSTEFVDEAFGD